MIPLFKSRVAQTESELSAGFELVFDVGAELSVPNVVSAGFDLIFDVNAEIENPGNISAGFDLIFEVNAELQNEEQELSAGFDLIFEVNAELQTTKSITAGFELLFDVGAVLDAQSLVIPEYSCLAVQGAVGGIGRKAATLVPAYSFNSLGEINGVPIGLSKNGLYRLFSGNKLVDDKFTKYFVLREHSIGYPGNLKKIRFVYIGCDGNALALRVWVMADSGAWIPCGSYTKHGRGIRCAPTDLMMQGVYWSVKIESTDWFAIDTIQIMPIIRPAGVST